MDIPNDEETIDEPIPTEKCIRCSNAIDTYNLCMKETKGRLCHMCLYVEDMCCFCKDKNPTEIKEEYRQDYNGNVKENIRIFNLEEDVIMRDCDNSFIKQQNNDTQSVDLVMENLKLKERLNNLEEKIEKLLNKII
jgi:hypothetical protein